MLSGGIFNWPDGAGWLILSGGNSDASIVRASVLTRAGIGPIAYLSSADHNKVAQITLEDMESLGAPSGYIVNTNSEDHETIYDLLTEAGIIVLEQEHSPHSVVENLRGYLDQVLGVAHENGALILAEGTTSTAFGSWLMEENEWLPALSWLDDVLITTEKQSKISGAPMTSLYLHIPNESAIALGPDGKMEIWGNQDVQITLGSEYFT